jgi:hypothetical protein
MLILVGLLAAVVLGWVLLGSRILPPGPEVESSGSPEAAGLDGRWTATPDEPLGTTFAIDDGRYELMGDLPFTGAGEATVTGAELTLRADEACADAHGRYRIELGDTDRYGLLPQFRAQTLTLALIADPCADGERARSLTGAQWVLRASGRAGVHGICDPPNEEAAITGHWPEPSGCS